MEKSSPSKTPTANFVWRALYWPVWLFFKIWIRLECTGLENLDSSKGGLLLINHQSYLDPLLAAFFLGRPVSFLARDNLFRIPVLGWILRKTYVIPISREATRSGSIRLAIERIEEGFLVGIFPEGTRSPVPEPQAFRPGFLAMLRRTSQPVYPVGLTGSQRALPRGAWFVRPARIHVAYGKPFTSEELEMVKSGNDVDFCELARQRVAACIRTVS